MKKLMIAHVTGSFENGPKIVKALIGGLARESGRIGAFSGLGGLAINDADPTNCLMSFKPTMGDYAGSLEALEYYESATGFDPRHAMGHTVHAIGHINGMDIVWGNALAVNNSLMLSYLNEMRTRLLSVIGPSKPVFYLPLVPSINMTGSIVKAGSFGKGMETVKLGKFGTARTLAIDVETQNILLGVHHGDIAQVMLVPDAKQILNGGGSNMKILAAFDNQEITNLAMPYNATMRIAMRNKKTNTTAFQKFDLHQVWNGAKEIKPVAAAEMMPEDYLFAGTAQSGHLALMNRKDLSLHYLPGKPEGNEISGDWLKL